MQFISLFARESLREQAAERIVRFSDSPEFVRFLDSLSPEQVSMLVETEALDDIVASEPVGEPVFDKSYPSATQREGFDFEKWKNRPGLKIR